MKKELYVAPEAESLKLMSPRQILVGSSDELNSTVDPLDLLGDDFSNWGGLL